MHTLLLKIYSTNQTQKLILESFVSNSSSELAIPRLKYVMNLNVNNMTDWIIKLTEGNFSALKPDQRIIVSPFSAFLNDKGKKFFII